MGNLVDYAIDPDSLELEGTEPVARGGCGEVWIARLRQPRNPPAEFPPPGQSGRVAVKKLKLSKTAKIGKKVTLLDKSRRQQTNRHLALCTRGHDMGRGPAYEHSALLGLLR